MKKIFALVMAVILVAGVFTLAGCGKTEDNNGAEKLILATSADFPPYEYIEGNGYAGIDIEIAGLIAKKLGRELAVENMNFNSIINAVETGKADIGMAGLTVNEDRLQSVDFTDSYATGVQAIIVPENSPIKTLDDIYADGAAYKFGVQLTTTGDIYISTEINDDKTLNGTVEQYTTGAEAVAALVAGKIDCVVIDNEPAKSFVAANKGLKVLDTEYAVEDYAICLAKGNTELLEQVNMALAELKADGTIDGIINKYIPAE